MKIKSVGIICAALMMSGTVSIAAAGEVKLPKNMSWTAYNTGTTGYNQSVAIGKALKGQGTMSRYALCRAKMISLD